MNTPTADDPRKANKPTKERRRHDRIERQGEGQHQHYRVKHAHRLDELYARRTIDGMQRLAGIRLAELWHRAGRPALKAAQMSDIRLPPSPEAQHLDRMSAIDEYIAVMRLMLPAKEGRRWKLAYAVSIEEMPLTDALRYVRLPTHRPASQIACTLDLLDFAISEVWGMKQEVDKNSIRNHEFD